MAQIHSLRVFTSMAAHDGSAATSRILMPGGTVYGFPWPFTDLVLGNRQQSPSKGFRHWNCRVFFPLFLSYAMDADVRTNALTTKRMRIMAEVSIVSNDVFC